MKRSGPPKTDADKLRAWQQRSALKAQETARGRPRSPLARVSGTARPRVEFRAWTPARDQPCFRGCGRRGAHWHHVLGQSAIRAYVTSLRIHDDDAEDALLRDLLGDERNLVSACVSCHLDRLAGVEVITSMTVPVSAVAFAEELGPEWAERLRRAYA